MPERSSETQDYPGLIVCDGRVTGSITAGRSRLPLWSFMHQAVTNGAESANHDWQFSQYGVTGETLAEFVSNLVQHRKEWARLVCTLADVERRSTVNSLRPWWMDRKTLRRRMIRQLRRCLAELEELERLNG